jgi:RNA polymerase sigma-70 factor (ECF subfamily)
MTESSSFSELLARVRTGDADAARELVDRYESAIRVAVRVRLSDPSLRRQFDSMDVCQSVLGSFFIRMAAGQYDLHEPAQLVALLSKMAQNKLAMQVRRHRQARRDVRRVTSLASGADPPVRQAGPATEVIERELAQQVLAMMDENTQQVARRRNEGASWGEIAGELGGTAEAHRKNYRRTLDRIAAQLGVD